jgi:hypothetical protein
LPLEEPRRRQGRSTVAAGQPALVVQNGMPMTGLLVSGNYSQMLRAGAAIGRTVIPGRCQRRHDRGLTPDAAMIGA